MAKFVVQFEHRAGEEGSLPILSRDYSCWSHQSEEDNLYFNRPLKLAFLGLLPNEVGSLTISWIVKLFHSPKILIRILNDPCHLHWIVLCWLFAIEWVCLLISDKTIACGMSLGKYVYILDLIMLLCYNIVLN